MDRLESLIREVHRRSLWQVLAIYVAASWAVLEAADVLIERLALPDWIYGFALILLLLGLPVVLATAFVQEGVRSGGGGAETPPPGAAEAAGGPSTGRGEGGLRPYDAGFRYARWLRNHPAFEGLRDEPRFRALRERLEADAARMRRSLEAEETLAVSR